MPATLAGLAIGATAKADGISLLSPTSLIKQPPPPLFGSSQYEAGAQETRFPGHLANREQVVVDLAEDGSPAAVTVTQRLTITGLGDFSFLVPAPATSVTPAPGSGAQPGLRDVGIVWQGFSAGHRVLAATVKLTSDADQGLPLVIRVDRSNGAVVVRLIDVAVLKLPFVTGDVPLPQLQAVLRRLRTAASGPRPAGVAPLVNEVGLQVNGTARGQRSLLEAAPLRVSGTVAVPGRAPVRIAAVLGNGGPPKRAFRLPGRGSPTLRLRVDLLDPTEILPTPAALAAAPDPLLSLQTSLARLALSWQYRHFLDSPDPYGQSSTTYLFRTAAQATAPALTPPRRRGGPDVLAIALASALGATALAGLVVLWAHM